MASRIDRLLTAQRDFVADASHQLRTPLTGLRLRLESARAETTDPAVHEEIDSGIAEVDRLAGIVGELLVLSRAGENDLPGERLALRDAVGRAAERWAPAAARRQQDLRVDAERAGSVWSARPDLDRVLDVLVENALAYAPAGSTVLLRATGEQVEVLDEGHGVGADEQDLVFERFHRGRAGRAGPPGTGLGLAIARGLAGAWEATVTLGDRDDGHPGARAAVRFPPPTTEDAA
jgi:signal transduction histidine kinase